MISPSNKEQGQTSIEYILMLFFAVLLVLLVVKDFMIPISQRVSGIIANQVEEMLSKNLHSIRIRR